MALSHFFRQSHLAVTAYNCFAYGEKGMKKQLIKDVLYETEPILKDLSTSSG